MATLGRDTLASARPAASAARAGAPEGGSLRVRGNTGPGPPEPAADPAGPAPASSSGCLPTPDHPCEMRRPRARLRLRLRLRGRGAKRARGAADEMPDQRAGAQGDEMMDGGTDRGRADAEASDGQRTAGACCRRRSAPRGTDGRALESRQPGISCGAELPTLGHTQAARASTPLAECWPLLQARSRGSPRRALGRASRPHGRRWDPRGGHHPHHDHLGQSPRLPGARRDTQA
eukprot:scaffold527_cov368-Prasinococcus_capsulatus_cf.AAC.36